ncbi:hypothetical protein PHYBLDRAFT_167695 [Phycomyces blakesleeanus NRRL 1555(-)]|uniref:Uncharacterized protein n=1 Tax=Phycomyces blakesleeanus (strain ATCC 8743b / DSM 1359 / FGSC 10004 / NBRC 33097 / NRRL 1555) TaxID=763407 RepID=A0A167MWH8_PHYB8|nr:hypothetical protein PHYBLDRAFT_167695 [Phycomyces blakesleeanus NRRL 1555(-)]OAD74274.1 hypothetical protein PHYBLDRAFT_167695 [Phycomyces blakesleeanus NRRL 1555(-)]|eukprot:XP_018292314.1 hypothetical protein PHYBLDRAFT_167695 [Phycomyces blakesleeanus NRRL 1555(-)]
MILTIVRQLYLMYKRPSRSERSKGLQKTDNKYKSQGHPLQTALSSLPQLAISLAILFMIVVTNTSNQQPNAYSSLTNNDTLHSLLWLTIASAGSLCLGSVFIYLQINNANYKDWKEHSWTRQAIQIASIAFVITIPSSHIALWPIYGWTTPFVVIPAFVTIFTCLHIGTTFLS